MKKNGYLLTFCIALLIFVGILTTYIYTSSGNKNKDGHSQYKIGAVFMTMNNPYFEVINQEIEAAVSQKGDLLITRDSNMDNDMQIRQIEQMIEENVDIIILNAVDWKGVKPALEEAKKAGIPVVAIDTEVYNTDLVASTLVSDNYEAGSLIARDLMGKLSGGNILLLEHSGNKASADRISGFLDTLNEAGWPYKIVDTLNSQGQLEIAEPLVTDILKTNTDIDIVFGLNDPTALGAMAALDATGMLSDVMVYGIDGAPEAKNMIALKKMQGTVAQSPTQTGQYTATCLYNILAGEDVDQKIVLPVELVTQSNIKNYSITSWE